MPVEEKFQSISSHFYSVQAQVEIKWRKNSVQKREQGMMLVKI